MAIYTEFLQSSIGFHEKSHYRTTKYVNKLELFGLLLLLICSKLHCGVPFTMSFQTLPIEIIALILECLPDFTSLLSMIESCWLSYNAYKIRSNTIVCAIFERSCIPVIRAYAALPSVSRKCRREHVRKRLRSTYASYESPLGLRLILQRQVIPESTAIAILRKTCDVGSPRFLRRKNSEILRMIEVDTTSGSMPDSSNAEFLVLMEMSRVIERQALELSIR